MLANTLHRCGWKLLCLSSVLALPLTASTLYEEDFESGSLTSWDMSGVNVTIQTQTSPANKRLQINGAGTALASGFNTEVDYTIQYDVSSTWSAPASLIFLYVDEDNYYHHQLVGSGKGIYRTVDGQTTLIQADPTNKVSLLHAGSAAATYKVYLLNDGDILSIFIDKDGDDVDYDMVITETDTEIVSLFNEGQVGFANVGSGNAFFDNLIITEGRVDSITYPLNTYYVDASTGDDARTPAQAMNDNTPWASLSRAAEVAIAGDTVLVAGGVYRETLTIGQRGAASAPITFQAMDFEDRPVIVGSDPVETGSWQVDNITLFNGQSIQVYSTTIDIVPTMLYQNERRMFVAQEPNQENENDPYDLEFFMDVPEQSSNQKLFDTDFLTQSTSDYWVGAELLLWDSAPNAVRSETVIAYVPSENAIYITPLGSNVIGNGPDQYAMRNHLGLLDAPGEFYVDTSVTPHRLYVLPYSGETTSTILATMRDYGIYLQTGSEHVVIDGFVIVENEKHGIHMGSHVNNIAIRNSDFLRNMSQGVNGRYVSDILIENSYFAVNYDNGINFSDAHNILIDNCELTRNGDNGIWVGGGTTSYWNSSNIVLRDSFLHRTSSRRRHADNYQMHQVKNILMENNVFLQEGDQNMWCQYTDNFTLRNNIFIGGALGINSAIHSNVYNNVFLDSRIRYSRHLNNHPQHSDYYMPQEVIIRNNVIINSGIDLPDAGLVDRFEVFTVDHNYYAIDNTHEFNSWRWEGYRLGLGEDTLVVTEQDIPVSAGSFSIDLAITWSHPSKIVFLYEDEDNHYWLGLTNGNKGVYRVMNGTTTALYTDPSNLLRLPHASPARGEFTISFSQTTNGFDIDLSRDFDGSTTNVTVSETDSTAVSTFTTGKVGVYGAGGRVNWVSIHDFTAHDGTNAYNSGFDNQDIAVAESPDDLTYGLESGSVAFIPVAGTGVGFGEGSIVAEDSSGIGDLFVALPDSNLENFDFRSATGSVLIDAGTTVDNLLDADGVGRPQGTAFDIGPYEQ